MDPNLELYNILKSYCGNDKLPVMDENSFLKYSNFFGKDVFRWTLAHFVVNERSIFPTDQIDHARYLRGWSNLSSRSTTECIKYPDEMERQVEEKYDDYKYPFSEHGLAVIEAGGNTYNDASNYWMKELRWECDGYNIRSPLGTWYNGTAKDLWRVMGPLWRGINGVEKDVDGNFIKASQGLSKRSYFSMFRMGAYIATQFKPRVAKTVYEATDAKKILDTSCGWGDRLCAFYATPTTEEYVGCDPNPRTFAVYKKMAVEYERLLGCDNPEIFDYGNEYIIEGTKRVHIYRRGAEDMPWETLNGFDLAFTSPPYFSTELYNKGGDCEADQSWAKYPTYEKWRDHFYLAVARNSFNAIKEDGHLMINIMDPTVGNQRYRSCDELVDSLKDHFIGQVGMRISKRAAVGTCFIENIWYFGKSKTENPFKKSTLDQFFS